MQAVRIAAILAALYRSQTEMGISCQPKFPRTPYARNRSKKRAPLRCKETRRSFYEGLLIIHVCLRLPPVPIEIKTCSGDQPNGEGNEKSLPVMNQQQHRSQEHADLPDQRRRNSMARSRRTCGETADRKCIPKRNRISAHTPEHHPATDLAPRPDGAASINSRR